MTASEKAFREWVNNRHCYLPEDVWQAACEWMQSRSCGNCKMTGWKKTDEVATINKTLWCHKLKRMCLDDFYCKFWEAKDDSE